MSVFNSLGSNYNFGFALKTVFSKESSGSEDGLKELLEQKYNGKAQLFYKGREALYALFVSLNFPKGSYVAINGFTCFVLYEAAKEAGLNVMFLDIEEDLNFSPETLRRVFAKNNNIKAVVIQNTLGYPADVAEISKICHEKNIILVEDLAHSVGAVYKNGEKAGSLGDFIVLSFSQDKIVDGIAGGALISKKPLSIDMSSIASKEELRIRLYPLLTFLIRLAYSTIFGKLFHSLFSSTGLLLGPMKSKSSKVSRMPALVIPLVLEAFRKHEENIAHRRKISKIYSEKINKKLLSSSIASKVDRSSNLRFPIFVESRESLITFLKNYGVYVSDIWYDAPISPKRYIPLTNYKKGECPKSERISNQILNLPTHINVSEKDAVRISGLVNKWQK